MNKKIKNESNHFLRYNGFDQKIIYQRRTTLMAIVALLEVLVKEIIEAEEKFFKDPKDFYSLETAVKSSAENFSAGFLSAVLSEMNEQLCKDPWRKLKYNICRHDQRTLITSVGDVTFESTYFKSRGEKGEYRYLLEDMLGLDAHERFSEAAETAILTEALKTSYEEATKVIPSKSEITKTTVMNKVHGIAEEIPFEEPEQMKKCKYLFIEADEDHVAEQHGRWSKENKGFISRLAYIYEYKQENPRIKGRKELVNTYYFSGLYGGSKGVQRFWEEVQQFIEMNYDPDELQRVFVIGDGGNWIKSATNYVDNSLYCIDKYHMTKYINAAANQMLDEAEVAKENLYRFIYKKQRSKFKTYIEEMLASANNQEPILELQRYALGNWSAVMRSYHNELLSGCSAEGHVSHVLSDRLSSRPMGWSQTGADRMSKLRCYERNHGREKIIDLVRYSRKNRLLKRTGTDDISMKKIPLYEIVAEHYNQSRSYIDRFQATIPGLTARKTASIRTQLKLL